MTERDTSKELWICGQSLPGCDNTWGFHGAFDTRQLAIDACQTTDYFIAPAVLNKTFPHESVEWVGGYYPLLQNSDGSTLEESA